MNLPPIRFRKTYHVWFVHYSYNFLQLLMCGFPIIRRGFPTICVRFSNYRCTVFLRLTHQHFHSGVKEDLAFRIRFLLILAYLHSVCGVWLLLKVHIPPLKRLNDIQEHDENIIRHCITKQLQLYSHTTPYCGQLCQVES